MDSSTYLSLVAVGRNDDYGGDFRSRLQLFVQWSMHHLTEKKINSEIIFVNYNPIDGESIERFVDWPKSNEYVTVRIITVPHRTHLESLRKTDAKDVPVLEYIAKNIGIRRAKGEFILSMNPDILISRDIFSQLSSLQEGRFYRANRVDYGGVNEVDFDTTLLEQLGKHSTSVWFKGSHTNVSGLTFRKYKILWTLKSISNWWKRNTIHLEWILKRINITTYHHNLQFRYHSNACGDFMLMSKQDWNRLKGYKEASYISLHVDSLMVIQAAFSGLKEMIFEGPIFHRQHERRFDAHNRLTQEQVKVYHKYNDDVDKMSREKKPIIYNDDNWGFAKDEFNEVSV